MFLCSTLTTDDCAPSYRIHDRFGCACAYMLLGLLCLDRFTAKAFLADEDQVAAAVSATQLRDVAPRESFDSYDQEDMSYSQNHNSYVPGSSYRAPNGDYSDMD